MMNNNLLRKLNEAEYSGSLSLLRKLDEADNYWKGEFDDKTSGGSNQPVQRKQLKTALTKVGGSDKSGLSGVFELIKGIIKLSGAKEADISRLEGTIDHIGNLVEMINIPTDDLNKAIDKLNDKQFVGLEPPVMSLENLALNSGSPDDMNLFVNVLEDQNQLDVSKLTGKNSIVNLANTAANTAAKEFLATKLGRYITSITNCTKNKANVGRGEILLALLFKDGKMPEKQGDVKIGNEIFELKGNGGSFKPGVTNSGRSDSVNEKRASKSNINVGLSGVNDVKTQVQAMAEFFTAVIDANEQKSMRFNVLPEKNIDITNYAALKIFAAKDIQEDEKNHSISANPRKLFINLAKAVFKRYLADQKLLLLDPDQEGIPFYVSSDAESFIEEACNGQINVGTKTVVLGFKLYRGGSDYRFTINW